MAKSKKETKNDYMERDFSAGSIRIYDGGKKRNDYGSISLDCGFVILQLLKQKKVDLFHIRLTRLRKMNTLIKHIVLTRTLLKNLTAFLKKCTTTKFKNITYCKIGYIKVIE